MILEGRYAHASDVWAFAILAWELYESYSASGQDRRKKSVPYHFLQNDQVNLRCFYMVSDVSKSNVFHTVSN